MQYFVSVQHKRMIKFISMLLSVGCLNSLALPAYATDYAEFDAIFLRGNKAKESIDIQRFSYGNPIPVGNYVADVYLNNTFKGRLNLKFADFPQQNSAALCLDETLISALDLKTELLAHSTQAHEACYFLREALPEAIITFDVANLRLDLAIPQIFIVQRPQGYISPAQWQTGTATAFLRYDASYYRYQYANVNAEQTYLGINAGVNLFGWAFRHQGTQSWDNQQRAPYQSLLTYAQHDIPAWRAQLTLGDFNTQGHLLESLALRGLLLSSDDRMLASSEQGYAPVIRGVANSNAQVTIRQNGQILRELTVPAGAFEINDLFPMNYGGDLQVEILEANGERRTFTVPYTATAQLIRPGYSRYQLALGRYRYANQLFSDNIAQATWQYGLTNNLTLNFGATFSKSYHAELIGVSFNTPIGAFATNAAFSHAKLQQDEQTYKGYSLSASYNTRLDSTNTNITLAAYRYLSRDYLSLQEVIAANNQNSLTQAATYHALFRLKNQFQLSINHQAGGISI